MKKRPLLTLLFIICYLFFILSACSEPSMEEKEEGYFTISLSAYENTRAVYPPTDTSDLKFVAKFRDIANGAEKTYTSDGSRSIQGKIDIGNYTVTMEISLISDSSAYARGIAFDNPVAIGSGQNQIKAYAYDVKNAAPPVISAKPQGATYTARATPTALTVNAFISDGGVLSYQWYSNTTNSLSNGTAISGATSPSYTPSTATPGTAWYYVEVKNTSTGNPTTINTAPVSIIVNPGSSSGGTGTEADPFLVNDVATLQKVGSGTDGWTLGAHYKQTADIDLASVRNWTPIGTETVPFTGSYDGNGKTISNLTINTPNEDDKGLFGYIDSGAVVKNVGLVNYSIVGHYALGGVVVLNFGIVQYCYATGNVSGQDWVGGVVAENQGTIQYCYFTGNVSGGYAVGGVAGYNNNGGTIQYCYSTGNASGNNYCLGGVVGYNFGTVQYCYTTGNASGLYDVGGVVGWNDGTTHNCVALNPDVSSSEASLGRVLGFGSGTNNFGRSDMQKNGSSTTWANIGLNDLDGASITSTNWGSQSWWRDTAGWNFTNVWEWGSNSLPILRNMPGTATQNPVVSGGGGVNPGPGTAANPFLVNDVTTLQKVGSGIDGWTMYAHYKQTADIALPAVSSGGSNWTPIGTSSEDFLGSYDGNGKTISNLTINAPTEDYQDKGLFGRISSVAVVKNVGVVNCTIIVSNYSAACVGGVVGRNDGTVQNCYTTGNVSGISGAGGVVGVNRGTVQNCYATANVSGEMSIGGVVGYNYNGSDNGSGMVQYCYATGSVSGRDYIGGVVGGNSGTVQNCYATGTILGNDASDYGGVGGVVGYNDNGTVQNCYATGNVSGYKNVGGVVGYLYQYISSVGSTVQNCVALNPNVSSTGYTDIGRVFYTYYGTPTLLNNYGRNDMNKNGVSTTWTNIGSDDLDGTSITSSNWGNQSWWRDTARWDFTNVWAWGPNNLPILRNMPGTTTQNPAVKP